ALEALAKAGQSGPELIERHRHGDWGAVSAEDWAANDRALADGERIVSAYCLKDGTKIWLITEADRSVTTFLLPDEY
ncbi:MAG: plasmid related protein, partial [Tepidisphaeraceae bacterium]